MSVIDPGLEITVFFLVFFWFFEASSVTRFLVSRLFGGLIYTRF
eukprot:SAG11_NODE_1039_length_6074_cov_11.968870_1_plen_44_part_00